MLSSLGDIQHSAVLNDGWLQACEQVVSIRQRHGRAGNTGACGSLMPLRKTAMNRHRQGQPAPLRQRIHPGPQLLGRIRQPMQNEAGSQQIDAEPADVSSAFCDGARDNIDG